MGGDSGVVGFADDTCPSLGGSFERARVDSTPDVSRQFFGGGLTVDVLIRELSVQAESLARPSAPLVGIRDRSNASVDLLAGVPDAGDRVASRHRRWILPEKEHVGGVRCMLLPLVDVQIPVATSQLIEGTICAELFGRR